MNRDILISDEKWTSYKENYLDQNSKIKIVQEFLAALTDLFLRRLINVRTIVNLYFVCGISVLYSIGLVYRGFSH